VSHDLPASRRHKCCIVNASPLLLGFGVLFYNIMFLFSGCWALILTGLVQLPIVAIGIIGFRYCQLKGIEISCWAVAGLLISDLLAAMLAGQGSLFNTHVYFLLFAMLASITVPLSRWPQSLMICTTHLCLFLWIDHFGMPAAPEVSQLPADVLAILSSVNYAAVVIGVMGFVYIGELFTGVLEDRLSRLADTDSLSGLPNRRAFQKTLSQFVARAERNHSVFSVAVIDIDNFKRINDSYGHACGDDVIKHVAKMMQEYSRLSDFVARIGGEEFVVLMSDIPIEGAMRLAERVRRAVDTYPCLSEQGEIKVSVSIGIAQWRDAMKDRSLFEAADKALYEAKQTGRNRVCTLACEEAVVQ